MLTPTDPMGDQRPHGNDPCDPLTGLDLGAATPHTPQRPTAAFLLRQGDKLMQANVTGHPHEEMLLTDYIAGVRRYLLGEAPAPEPDVPMLTPEQNLFQCAIEFLRYYQHPESGCADAAANGEVLAKMVVSYFTHARESEATKLASHMGESLATGHYSNQYCVNDGMKLAKLVLEEAAAMEPPPTLADVSWSAAGFSDLSVATQPPKVDPLFDAFRNKLSEVGGIIRDTWFSLPPAVREMIEHDLSDVPDEEHDYADVEELYAEIARLKEELEVHRRPDPTLKSSSMDKCAPPYDPLRAARRIEAYRRSSRELSGRYLLTLASWKKSLVGSPEHERYLRELVEMGELISEAVRTETDSLVEAVCQGHVVVPGLQETMKKSSNVTPEELEAQRVLLGEVSYNAHGLADLYLRLHSQWQNGRSSREMIDVGVKLAAMHEPEATMPGHVGSACDGIADDLPSASCVPPKDCDDYPPPFPLQDWTSEPPKVPGYYWMKMKPEKDDPDDPRMPALNEPQVVCVRMAKEFPNLRSDFMLCDLEGRLGIIGVGWGHFHGMLIGKQGRTRATSATVPTSFDTTKYLFFRIHRP